MPLMDRIYVKSFLEMPYPEQAKLVDKVRAIRSSALSVAKTSSKRITRSAIKNISNAKKGGKRKMLRDPTKAAKNALDKLSPDQIALIAGQLQNL